MWPSVLYLFIIDYFLLKCSGFGPMLGPADLIIKSFGYCEPKASGLDFSLVNKKWNRTVSVLDIDVVTPYQLDDSVVLELKGYMKKEGGYKPGSFYLKDKYCTVLKTMLGDLFTLFLNIAGREDCPIPEGTYEIRDFYFDNSKFTVPQIYGEMKSEVFIYREEEVIACYIIYYDLVPKGQR